MSDARLLSYIKAGSMSVWFRTIPDGVEVEVYDEQEMRDGSISFVIDKVAMEAISARFKR